MFVTIFFNNCLASPHRATDKYFCNVCQAYFSFSVKANIPVIQSIRDSLLQYSNIAPAPNAISATTLKSPSSVAGFNFAGGEMLMAYAYAQTTVQKVDEDHQTRTYYQ